METLNLILLIENIMGVYRNYSTLGKKQNLAFYRMLFEISVQIASLVLYYKCSDVNSNMVYYTLTYLSSMFIILIAVYHSKEFGKIIKQHADFRAYFPTDEVYERNIKSRKKIVYFFMIAHNLFYLVTYSVYYLQDDKASESECSSGLFYAIELSVHLSDFRFMVEIPILTVFFYALVDQLDAISRSLKTEINCLKRYKAQHRCDDTFYSQFGKGKIFDDWSAAYTIVVKKAEICKHVFGLQITALVLVVVIYYVMLMYTMVVLSVRGQMTPLMLFMMLFTLAQFLAALFILSRAAQRANNTAKILRRRLCTLLVHSLGCKKQYKATRDFLRLMRNHPIQTRAFGINVDMMLPPTCIAFSTSYTVIALQFNNIV